MPTVSKPRDSGKVAIDMTPMIDIVFQLLTFFCMTLKIATAEGDFQIKMPLTTPGTPPHESLPPIQVHLQADAQGDCTRVVVNELEFSGPDRWDRVHRHLAGMVGDGGLAKEVEVKLRCDPQLQYHHTMAAITAISGRVDPESGQIIKLIEKISF